MKRFAFIVVLVILVAAAGGVIYGFAHSRQKRAETEEFTLCETQFKEGKYKEAIQLLKTFLDDHPGSKMAGDAYHYLAKSRQNLKDYPQAMEAWSKIIKSYSKSKNIAEAYYYSGFGYQNNGQYDKAMEDYRIVTEKYADAPVVAGAWFGLGRICEMKGQESEAANAYRIVVEKYANTEFATDAERGLGSIKLKGFLAENSKPYAVARKDSLEKIAAKFHIGPGLIMRLNNLKKAVALQVGQTLMVVNGVNFNILLDLSDRRLSLRDGDKVIRTYPVCVGKKETPTPTGNFKVTDKMIDPTWYSTTSTGAKGVIPPGDPRNELSTRWIGFKPAYGFHGTIFPESIGKAESHGCVRLFKEDAEELYEFVVSGTPVKIVE